LTPLIFHFRFTGELAMPVVEANVFIVVILLCTLYSVFVTVKTLLALMTRQAVIGRPALFTVPQASAVRNISLFLSSLALAGLASLILARQLPESIVAPIFVFFPIPVVLCAITAVIVGGMYLRSGYDAGTFVGVMIGSTVLVVISASIPAPIINEIF
jgi:hypothetical protein